MSAATSFYGQLRRFFNDEHFYRLAAGRQFKSSGGPPHSKTQARIPRHSILGFQNNIFLAYRACFASKYFMPDWIAVVILAVVEGITEFIPVSSTGHLLMAEHLLRVKESDLFNIVIQCGAVIAVLPLFPQRLYKFVFEWQQKETKDYLLKILVAFGITGAVGFVLDKKGLQTRRKPGAHRLGIAPRRHRFHRH